MNKYLLLLISFIVSNSLFAMDENNGTRVGNTAKNFSISRIDGTEFKLSDFKGKKAVNLIFWATWCSNCKAEIPSLKSLSKNYGTEIEMLAVNVAVNDSMKRLTHYRKKYSIDYPMAYDEDHQVANSYGVMGTPTLIIIDIDGIIRYRGAEVPDDIAEHINNLMGR